MGAQYSSSAFHLAAEERTHAAGSEAMNDSLLPPVARTRKMNRIQDAATGAAAAWDDPRFKPGAAGDLRLAAVAARSGRQRRGSPAPLSGSPA
ncbi:hypothetical protein A6R79_17840 [Xanthomonas translucens pv. translucens]|nr:hypothetical protein A6R79_17840 [Xanthomonas translucens pv. translucens]